MNFIQWGSVKEVANAEAQRSLDDPRLRRCVISVRNCYRNKTPGQELTAKGRVVVIGFADPDLTSLRRNSATASRAGFVIVLQLYASH